MMMININETAEFLMNHNNYLILTHKRPDGDAHGSAAAIALILRRAGKNAFVLPNPETTEKFIPFIQPYWAPDDYLPDTVISVDLANEDLLPSNAQKFKEQVKLSIDHHPSNSGYANNTCLNKNRASCGEIVFELMMALNQNADELLATLLYIAVSTDTGCFSFANTNANTFLVAAHLAGSGANIAELNKTLFRTKSRKRFILEAMIMSSVEFYYNGLVAVISVTKSMMEETGCTENDMDDIAALPGSIEGVVCGITLRELSSKTDCKASVRTTDRIDANKLCSVLGGGGHVMASGASPNGLTIHQIKKALLTAVSEQLCTETEL